MIHYIKGQYVMQFDGGVVIDVGGIGYEIYVPSGSEIYHYSEGQNVMLYTHMAVREDDVSLYGFCDKEGLKLFRQLMTVSGIGAKAAMSILSAMSVDDCKRAIAFEDVAMITQANGIGKKTAQRVVLELKDKVNPPLNTTADGSGMPISQGVSGSGAPDARNEAINALMALGYSRSEALTALGAVSDAEGMTSEDYIKQALKQLF